MVCGSERGYLAFIGAPVRCESHEFVRLGLRQTRLSGERIRVVGQHFEIARSPGLETDFREQGRILG